MTERIWGTAYVPPKNNALLRATASLEGRRGRLLEVGCGAGRFVRTIVRESTRFTAFGSDISVDSLKIGRSYLDHVEFSAATMDQLPYATDSFDVVVLFDVLEHVPDPDAGLREIARVLRPGGLFHALIPCEGQPGTLHWALWKLGPGGDLKERHGAHIQRFTRRGVQANIERAGMEIRQVTYSMHPLGQVRDILTYVAMEPWFKRVPVLPRLHEALSRALWPGAYVESWLLKSVERGAAVIHVDAVKRA